MSSRVTSLIVLLLCFFVSIEVSAQSAQYKRAKPKASKAKGKKGEAKKSKSDKLDISDLEQKYWAPKDTDFSVVQNRTYTKEGRFSASFLVGPIVNDPFNEGNNYGFRGNYYFSERHGMEFTYIDSDLSDSDAIENFRTLSGGGTRPDYNREDTYIGIGYNFVPIYAKVSFLGKKILYFDMQVTPHIGMSDYEQKSDEANNGNIESSFSYGIDVTQYLFFHDNFALRFDLHNRWYDHDVLGYSSGQKVRTTNHHTTMFLFGLTYFH